MRIKSIGILNLKKEENEKYRVGIIYFINPHKNETSNPQTNIQMNKQKS